MAFKDFGILLVLLMVSTSLAGNLNKTVESVTKTTDTVERKNEIYLKEGMELLCGTGSVAGLHIATEPKQGWFCNTGYARNLDGTCVHLDKCDSKSFIYLIYCPKIIFLYTFFL